MRLKDICNKYVLEARLYCEENFNTLTGVDAAQLTVYSKLEFEKEFKVALEEDLSVEGLGQDKKNALVVVVPNSDLQPQGKVNNGMKATVDELLLKELLQNVREQTHQFREQTHQFREQTHQTEAIIPFIHDIVMNMFDLVATSDRTTNKEIKLSSINNYNGSTLQELPATTTCQFLSIELPTKFITCSHIFQKRWKPHRHLIGLAEIHDYRNTLLLLKPIEVLFDQGQIIFLWNQQHQAFEMKILNPSIRSAWLHTLFIDLFPDEVLPANIPNVLIGALENRHLVIGQSSPYKRCLAFHASVCRYEAIKKSMWIKAEDFPRIPEDAWSPGIAEQPKLRRYLDAWIDSGFSGTSIFKLVSR